MYRSLLVLPDDSAQPILQAIYKATSSLRVKMFVFSDPALLEAVIASHRRGVKVQVMLNPTRRNGAIENNESRALLSDAGVQVRDSNPAFDLTHEKSMVVDDGIAFVQSLNWETENLSCARDYAVVTSHKHEVKEVMDCFDADWNRTSFESGHHSHLIWCVGNGRQRLGRLIDEAKHSLWLQNERYQDPAIIEHLVRANQRGVKIRIMARPPHKLKKEKLIEGVSGLRILQDIGVKIHELKHMKLHAKLIFADETRAVIGSINLAPGSFDSRRELAIETDDYVIAARLKAVLKHDWENSHAMDLSDRGLLKDLHTHDPQVCEDFGIKGNITRTPK